MKTLKSIENFSKETHMRGKMLIQSQRGKLFVYNLEKFIVFDIHIVRKYFPQKTEKEKASSRNEG